MRRRFSPFAYVVFGLIALGILSRFVANPSGMIIPLAVFGLVFWLWKFPPQRWKRNPGGGWTNPGAKPREKPNKVRKARFRVIPGSKKPNDPEEPPKYH